MIISYSMYMNNINAPFLTLVSIIIPNWTGRDALKLLVCTGYHPEISAAIGTVFWPLNRYKCNITSLKLFHSLKCYFVCLTTPKQIPSQNSWQDSQVLVEKLLYLQRKEKETIFSPQQQKWRTNKIQLENLNLVFQDNNFTSKQI